VLGLNDAGEILTLQRAAYLTEAAAHNDFGLPPLTQTLAELADELADATVTALGIRDSGRLVGAVRVRRSGSVVELGRLIVAPDRQGQGIGTRLLLHAETMHPEASEMRLFTGEHSTANLRLYTRHGYHETSRTPAGDYQLVHLVKTLR
jgi:ribosomal protein S18 acetylase RimI-like enzyme